MSCLWSFLSRSLSVSIERQYPKQFPLSLFPLPGPSRAAAAEARERNHAVNGVASSRCAHAAAAAIGAAALCTLSGLGLRAALVAKPPDMRLRRSSSGDSPDLRARLAAGALCADEPPQWAQASPVSSRSSSGRLIDPAFAAPPLDVDAIVRTRYVAHVTTQLILSNVPPWVRAGA
jgi:hypothetical protein